MCDIFENDEEIRTESSIVWFLLGSTVNTYPSTDTCSTCSSMTGIAS